MRFSTPVEFIYNWSDKVKVALICGAVLAFIMIFLQPFDTFQSTMRFKGLKLSGYALAVVIPILLAHIAERVYFLRHHKTWLFRYEIVTVAVIMFLISVAAYGYHGLTFSDLEFSEKAFLLFSLNYSLPFVPILVPVMIYSRFKFGSKTIDNSAEEVVYYIYGDNQEDKLEISSKSFLYAQAQQNYVDLYFLDAEGRVQKKIIRSTFSRIVKQLSKVEQVHRSFAVNFDLAQVVKGNSRKRVVKLYSIENEIPVGVKYYGVLKGYLQNRP
ncbi:MAG: LytTR family DNA-binding domain-containing protein [Bacteroidota bacterium]